MASSRLRRRGLVSWVPVEYRHFPDIQDTDTYTDFQVPLDEGDILYVPNFKDFESIGDVVGNRHGMNPCSHLRYRVAQGDGERVGNYYGLDDSYVTPLIGIAHDVTSYPFPSVSSSAIADFAWDAFQNATTQIPHEVELPNFLAELGDFKSLLKAPKSLFEAVKSGQLGWDFAIKPFLSDVKSLYGTLKALRKRLKWLAKTSGKVVPIHYSRTGTVDLDQFTTPAGGLDTPDVVGYAYLYMAIPQARVLKYRLSSTILFRHYIQGLDDAWRQLDALMAALGFNNLINTVWNAIPFSFVVEWFVNLEHVLNAFAVPPFKWTVEILDSCWSLRSECIYETYVYDAFEQPGGQWLLEPKKAGTVFGRKYTRSKGLPLSSMIFLEDGLTEHQKWLFFLLFSKG